MIRLAISVEGQTEEEFVSKSLTAHLGDKGVYATPEDINDNATTAPSHRIRTLIPRYRKTLDGPELALEIGLETIRGECPRFDSWVCRLESLGEPTA